LRSNNPTRITTTTFQTQHLNQASTVTKQGCERRYKYTELESMFFYYFSANTPTLLVVFLSYFVARFFLFLRPPYVVNLLLQRIPVLREVVPLLHVLSGATAARFWNQKHATKTVMIDDTKLGNDG
jgi:hypothetical protein